MPQSIYQGETYIGETIQSNAVGAVPAYTAATNPGFSFSPGGTTRGQEIRVNRNGYCTALRFNRINTSTVTTRPLRLWTLAGVLLATAKTLEPAGSAGWVEVTLQTPVLLTAGQSYVLSADTFTGKTDFFAADTTPVASETADVTLVQARYASVVGGFPDVTRASVQEGMDLRFVPVPIWQKMPVMNWIGGMWVQLNAEIGPVDFSMTSIASDRATIQIHNSQYYDHTGPYEVWLQTGAYNPVGAFVYRPDLEIPDVPTPRPGQVVAQVMATKLITGLAANTNYTVRIRTGLVSGGFTPYKDVTFKTPVNPTPFAVSTLRMTAHTNTYIDLAWTKPAGSSATSYRVVYGRAGQGPTATFNVPTASTYRVTGLRENTPYWYYVKGVTALGLEGPVSNRLQYHTGWGEIRRTGSDENIIWKPREWGSYRQDIKWKWARESGVLPKNPHLYQGYWPGDNWHGASNPSANIQAGKERRYWGTVVYTDETIRAQLDAKHGSGVGAGIVTSKLSFRRLYRHTNPGFVGAQDMVWHMTNSNPFSSGQPPTYETYESHDMRQGEVDNYYPLRASWGTKLIRGLDDGTAVNGLVLHRSDNQTNGYGAAGYGRWSGHMLHDPDTSGSGRYSDLSLMIEGSWNVLIRAFKGPYPW